MFNPLPYSLECIVTNTKDLEQGKRGGKRKTSEDGNGLKGSLDGNG